MYIFTHCVAENVTHTTKSGFTGVITDYTLSVVFIVCMNNVMTTFYLKLVYT